jgi:inorganic triphosphatase YgiF
MYLNRENSIEEKEEKEEEEEEVRPLFSVKNKREIRLIGLELVVQ